MNAELLKQIIQEQISEVEAAIAAGLYPDSSAKFIGRPRAAESVKNSILLLKHSLVEPVRRTLVDASPENTSQGKTQVRDFWFVCKGEMGYWVVYDDEAGEFGLAVTDDEGNGEYIGVSGDIVGVFMAI